MSTKPKNKPSDAEIIPATFARLMAEKGSVEKALDALHANLSAKRSRYDAAKGEWIVEDDGPTQVASAKALLAWGIGEPVKRQQILSGKIPTTPPTADALRDTITAKLAARIEMPDVSVAELVAARKALAEQEADAPAPKLTPAEQDEEIKAILGIE